MKENGIFLSQGESENSFTGYFLRTHNTLKNVFGSENASIMFYYQPIYEFGKWAFQMAVKNKEGCNIRNFCKKNLDENTIEEFVKVNNLKYYNYDVHMSAFTQTPHVKQMLAKNENTEWLELFDKNDD